MYEDKFVFEPTAPVTIPKKDKMTDETRTARAALEYPKDNATFAIKRKAGIVRETPG